MTTHKEALTALVHEMEYVLSCINADKVPFDGDDFHEALRLGKEVLAQPEQEPVAWMRDDEMKAMVAVEKMAWIESGRRELVDEYNKPLYKRPWEDTGVPYTVVECNCSGKTTLYSPPQPLKEPTNDMVLTLMGNSFLGKEDARDALWDILQETPLYTHPPVTTAQPEQEPVIGTKTWFEDGKVVTQYLHPSDIYTTPPQRTWVGLTDEDYQVLREGVVKQGKPLHWMIEHIEAKLKEKNT